MADDSQPAFLVQKLYLVSTLGISAQLDCVEVQGDRMVARLTQSSRGKGDFQQGAAEPLCIDIDPDAPSKMVIELHVRDHQGGKYNFVQKLTLETRISHSMTK
jgi:hypothetical protein